jgi:hypothetical protein
MILINDSGRICLFKAFHPKAEFNPTICYFGQILSFSVGMNPANIFSGKSAERVAQRNPAFAPPQQTKIAKSS